MPYWWNEDHDIFWAEQWLDFTFKVFYQLLLAVWTTGRQDRRRKIIIFVNVSPSLPPIYFIYLPTSLKYIICIVYVICMCYVYTRRATIIFALIIWGDIMRTLLERPFKTKVNRGYFFDLAFVFCLAIILIKDQVPVKWNAMKARL